MLWHARLGHVGFETVRRAAHTAAATGVTAHTKNCNCHTCLLQKASRRQIKGSFVKRASVIGDFIHTDLAGQMLPTIRGYKYVQSFIDGRTRLKYIYLLKKKSKAGGALLDCIVKFEREHDFLVKSAHADNAAEFTGSDFNSYLRDQGINFTSSVPYSPKSNGLAENFNKVLFARVRFLLDHSGMDKVMWGEAALHAVHLLNITPSRSLGNITPDEATYGVVPDVSKLRVFGCVAFATLPHPKKLNDKAVRATNLGFIGYGKYRLLLSGPDYRIFVATSVKFDEQVFEFAADAVKEVTGIRNITGGDDIINDDMHLLANDDENEDEYEEGSKAAPPVDAQNSDNHAGNVKGQEVEEVEGIRRYTFRNRTKTPACNLAAHATQTPDSLTISSALASTNKDKWLEAIDKEVSALEYAGTWTMVPHQPGMNILRSHLVLKANIDTAGAIIKYKARLVAGGCTQVHGLDFDQSYAPAADFTIVRVILSIAARENRVVHSLDVSNAFVRAPLAEILYVRPPKILADRFRSNIMKLKKAQYGLKQAPLS
jgi:Reverse transcriptase (RNA-dependent DNA polymerase)/GAG-pre-integrase domain